MKHSHRRKILRDLASLFAVPFALRSENSQAALNLPNQHSTKRDAAQTANGARSVRPTIAAPNGSVMRRG